MILSSLSSTVRFILVGADVSASLSPYLHNNALAALGEQGSYEALSLPATSLEGLLPALHARGIRGINLTNPYKAAILQYIPCQPWQDPLVQSLGATNTLLWKAGGYRPFNTDVWGFERSLEGLPGLMGATVAVLGAGGAARAVVAVLLKKGIKHILLINRSLGRLEELIKQFQDTSRLVPYLADDPLLASLSGLQGIVQTTGARLGEPFPLSFLQLCPSAFVYDLNYEPQGTTPLVEAARALGFRAQDGREMLAAQAAAAMALWLDENPEVLNRHYQAIMQRKS